MTCMSSDVASESPMLPEAMELASWLESCMICTAANRSSGSADGSSAVAPASLTIDVRFGCGITCDGCGTGSETSCVGFDLDSHDHRHWPDCTWHKVKQACAGAIGQTDWVALNSKRRRKGVLESRKGEERKKKAAITIRRCEHVLHVMAHGSTSDIEGDVNRQG